MMWWTGNGLWMGLLIGLTVTSANKAMGPMGVPLGLLSTAVLIFVLRGGVFEDASLFSIQARFWPPLLLVVAALTYLPLRA
jgi:hypothetical protein